MNTQVINAELVQALRKCLPFVAKHARMSGGDGSITHAYALRVLCDVDAAVAARNVADAGRERQIAKSVNFAVERGREDGYLHVTAFRYEDMAPRTTATARADSINAADAKMQAARAVRPAGTLQAAWIEGVRPAKGCDCDICTQYRRAGLI